MFEELPQITDPAAALFNLVDLYQAVLSELELPVNVSSVATLLCYRLNFSLEACAQPAVSGGARCGPLLSVYFPSSFAVRQCADRSALICFEDEQPQCVFEGAPANVRPQLARSLACPLIQLLRLALRQFTLVITWPIFAEQVRDSVEQLATLLLNLASCEDDMAAMSSGNESSITAPLPSLTTSSTFATSPDASSTNFSSTTRSSITTSSNINMTSVSVAASTSSLNGTTLLSDRTDATISSSLGFTTEFLSQSPGTSTMNSAPTRITAPTRPQDSDTTTSATATPGRQPSLTTNERTTAMDDGTTNYSTTSQGTNTSLTDTNTTTTVTTTRASSPPVDPGQSTVSPVSGASSSRITTVSVQTNSTSGSGNYDLSTTASSTTNTSVTVPTYPTTSTGPSATASSGTSSDVTPTSSVTSSPSPLTPVSTQTSMLGPSTAPAEDEESGTPANVTASTITGSNQASNSVYVASSTRAQGGTTAAVSTSPPSFSSDSDRTTSTSPSNTESPFTFTRSPTTRCLGPTLDACTTDNDVYETAGNVVRCINESTKVCRGEEPLQESLVSSLLSQVKCILFTILGDAPSSVLSGILCEVSSILAEKVRQLPYYGFLRRLLKPVLKLLRRIVGCQCTNIQLPNVLAMGTCVFRMMPQITGPIQTFFYLRAVIAGVLSRVQSDQSPVDVVNMMCSPFGLPIFHCEDGLPNTITCGPPINMSLPVSFDINNNETMTEIIDFLVAGLVPDLTRVLGAGLVPDLTRVLGCVLQILPQIGSPVSVLYNVVGLLEAVLARLGLSGDIGGLADILCRPLGIPLFSCGTFSPGNIACQEPLRISLPSVFNVGADPILRELLQGVGCILSVAPEGLQLDLVSSLVCPLVDILNFVTGRVHIDIAFPVPDTGS
ncbi:hypothetical protein HPB50_008813 [Hyalomma asiaticum]|uniref:Uncharacterized protein n=1 Tax=Hyalomma asiaticum TaxID=266040 RepID=A0ACB7T9H4_HYAAI|nr:hypothetical protein HPB50_008813 [Hyalomma asiaticum]